MLKLLPVDRLTERTRTATTSRLMEPGFAPQHGNG
jgi:hypothetical protein